MNVTGRPILCHGNNYYCLFCSVLIALTSSSFSALHQQLRIEELFAICVCICASRIPVQQTTSRIGVRPTELKMVHTMC